MDNELVCKSCPHYRNFKAGAVCAKTRHLVSIHVGQNRCPINRFGPIPDVESKRIAKPDGCGCGKS